MSASGLSRRRVATTTDSSETGTTSSQAPSPSRTTASVPTTYKPSGNGSTTHAGTAFEGGSKIAYDPRDLESNDDAGKMPRLTIMEEVLLLGLKDKQGYLSFWNDNISYALRGCILLELALRRRIGMVKDSSRRRLPLPERHIELIDERQTGETILDEAMKMIKSSEKMGVGSWIDLMSGETWNVMKIGYQLKQVRERLAKGLVDKGVLRTEKRNFLLFDMATHPVSDGRTKEELTSRVVALLTARTASIPPQALGKEEGVRYRTARVVCLVCAAFAASVLENALQRLTYEGREEAITRCDEILAEFAVWPLGSTSSRDGGGARRREGSGGGGSSEQVAELVRQVRGEIGDAEDICFEVVVTVLEVFSKMDSLI